MMRKLTILNCTIAAVVLLLNGCERDRRDADVNADTAAIETMLPGFAKISALRSHETAAIPLIYRYLRYVMHFRQSVASTD